MRPQNTTDPLKEYIAIPQDARTGEVWYAMCFEELETGKRTPVWLWLMPIVCLFIS